MARVHQIYSGYSTDSRWSKIRKFILVRDGYRCQWGKVCNEKFVSSNKLVVHHIDGDDRNNKTENLITLCRKCHTSFHASNNGEYKEYACELCNRHFTNQIMHTTNRCNECLKSFGKGFHKNKYKWSRKYDKCIECGKAENKHFFHGYCIKCGQKKRYSENKEYYLTRNAEWSKKHPERYKEILKNASIKYRKKHRKELNKKAREDRRKKQLLYN